MSKTYLIHYASPYYDPVKAHEYYEEHKKLKGRKSTAGLNDSGKEAAKYVKKQIDDEKNRLIEKAKVVKTNDTNSAKSYKDSSVESRKNIKDAQIEQKKNAKDSTIENNKREMNIRIDSLRNQLKNMSKQDRAAHREQIQGKISELRDKNKEMRAQLTEQFKADKEGINSSYKSDREKITNNFKSAKEGINTTYKNKVAKYRSDADEKYVKELDKMKADKSMQSDKKKSSKS